MSEALPIFRGRPSFPRLAGAWVGGDQSETFQIDKTVLVEGVPSAHEGAGAGRPRPVEPDTGERTLGGRTLGTGKLFSLHYVRTHCLNC